jgi:cobalt-zinc-cadmium efflux system outer membrane protein
MDVLRLAIMASPLVLGACATVPLGTGEAISARLERDVGAGAVWVRDEDSRTIARERVAALLQSPLGPDGAVQIALVNNPRVTAAFEGLGVARADFVGAVLPAAPALHFLELQPEDGGYNVLEYAVGFDLLRLVTLPSNVRASTGTQEAARAQATAQILAIAGQARSAWIDYAAARQTADLMAQAADTAAASLVAADALLAAGNIAQVERDREALYAAEIRVANLQAQAALVPARERLVAALGLDADQMALLRDFERLPAPPEEPITLPDLEGRVVSASTDLAIAAGTLEAARAHRSVSWFTSIFPGLSIDAARERDDGAWKEGLGFSWIAPLFDLGGADRLRRASAARQAEAIAVALDLEIRAEARTRLAEAEAARQIAVMRRTVILPLSTDVFDGAVRDFNAMEIGILQLLQERRARLEAGRAAIQATADYWQAQARLDLLLAGGRAGGGAAASQPTPARAPDPGH